MHDTLGIAGTTSQSLERNELSQALLASSQKARVTLQLVKKIYTCMFMQWSIGDLSLQRLSSFHASETTMGGYTYSIKAIWEATDVQATPVSGSHKCVCPTKPNTSHHSLHKEALPCCLCLGTT